MSQATQFPFFFYLRCKIFLSTILKGKRMTATAKERGGGGGEAETSSTGFHSFVIPFNVNAKPKTCFVTFPKTPLAAIGYDILSITRLLQNFTSTFLGIWHFYLPMNNCIFRTFFHFDIICAFRCRSWLFFNQFWRISWGFWGIKKSRIRNWWWLPFRFNSVVSASLYLLGPFC